MSNPTISFRLSEFHLARALHIIRQFEPNYKITSPSNIVKTCFFDYLAKMNLNRSTETPPEIIIELNNFISGESKQALNLDDLINLNTEQAEQEQEEYEQPKFEQVSQHNQVSLDKPKKDDKEIDAEIANEISKFESLNNIKFPETTSSIGSKISSVSDFSPPDDWKINDEE